LFQKRRFIPAKI